MNKLKIKIITLGHIPITLNKNKILSWKSELFELVHPIDEYPVTADSDLYEWQYSDDLISSLLPDFDNADFLFAITSLPLEDNWYSRRLSNNRVVFTLHEIRNILSSENIPLENAVYRVIYAYCLGFIRNGKKIPLYNNELSFTHDETKGCLFDMNGVKSDITESCNKPIICDSCFNKLAENKVPKNTIELARKEIKKIRKQFYYRVSDYVKSNPIKAFTYSVFFALFLGALGSIIGSILFEIIFK